MDRADQLSGIQALVDLSLSHLSRLCQRPLHNRGTRVKTVALKNDKNECLYCLMFDCFNDT